MRNYLKWMENQSRVIRILLCIWIADITWAVYRIGKAALHKNVLELVIAILWVVLAGTVGWILDLVWMILFDKIFWFDLEK